MPQATISVVIPAYGRLQALLRAIDSVRASDSVGIEILVIDDASPDPVAPHLPAENRNGIAIRGFRLVSNSGPQAARNLGVRRARYDYLAFLDSDDVFLPGKLDRAREVIAESKPDVIFHAVEGLPSYARLAAFWNRRLRRVLPFDWLLALLNPVVTPSLVIRKAGKLGPPTFRHSEDWAFLLHAVEPGMRVIYLDEPLAAVHRPVGSSGGQSAQRWKMRKGEFAARYMLLRDRRRWRLAKFALGSAAGVARVVADLVRGRYRARPAPSRAA